MVLQMNDSCAKSYILAKVLVFIKHLETLCDHLLINFQRVSIGLFYYEYVIFSHNQKPPLFPRI